MGEVTDDGERFLAFKLLYPSKFSAGQAIIMVSSQLVTTIPRRLGPPQRPQLHEDE